MLTTALLPQSAPLEPMHAQYVPVLTDIAPLLLIRELPQDEYPTPALPRPFTSQDVDPVMFGPNITGEFPNNDNEYEKYYSGAFSIGSVRLSGYSDADASTGQTGLFRASRSSSTYGSSTTVQPASVRSLFCIKS